ncbi:MAG: outer membrane protein assembly factor BamD [Nitrospirae bacterium]|nr:outer membrane protein assembly factor BamD [Nitrospirota bacterium]
MKKALAIVLLVLLAACAKEPPFDPVDKFKDAENKMQKFKYEEARKAYQEIQEKAPDRSYDADIMLRIADTYYGEEKYAEAQVEYQAFINFHPVHRDASYAQYQIGMCSYQEITTIDRDPALTRTALKEFQALLTKYPGSPYEEEAKKYIAVCRDKLAEYELYVGRFYHKKGSYLAAVGRFEKLLKDYPGSTAEKDALYFAGLSYQELGEKAKAISDFETLAAKYPAMAKEAHSIIAKLKAK